MAANFLVIVQLLVWGVGEYIQIKSVRMTVTLINNFLINNILGLDHYRINEVLLNSLIVVLPFIRII